MGRTKTNVPSENTMPDSYTVGEDVQLDLFVPLKTPEWPVKDDVSSMEYPLFSLSKNKDLRIRTYSRGGRFIKIIPSVVGAATVFDKDLLIYAVSQIVKGKTLGIETSRRVRVDVTPFLRGTNRSTGGKAYERVIDMCTRLRSTTLVTNVKSTEEEATEGFGLIDDFKVTQRTSSGKGALEVEITISEWLYRATMAYDVLTLHPDYFKLTQPLERRLAEIARKHCGAKNYWKINIDLLREKTGSVQTARRFKQELKAIIELNRLPDYRVALDEAVQPNDVVFFTKDHHKLFTELRNPNISEWIQRLL